MDRDLNNMQEISITDDEDDLPSYNHTEEEEYEYTTASL